MNIFQILVPVLLFAVACSPKTGLPEKNAASKAPAIPLPAGSDLRKTAPKPGTAPAIRIGKAETFRLDNGLTVILVENHKLPRASFRVFVDYDPIDEKNQAGMLDIFSDLFPNGTRTRTKAQIDEEVDFLGARLSTSAYGVSGACLSKHTDKLLEVMSDVLLHPAFPEAEFQKALVRTESNLANYQDDPESISSQVGAALRYGKSHPYGQMLTPQTLKKIDLESIRQHYKTYFKPQIAYLVMVGDLSRDKAEKLAKQYFGSWAKGDVPKHEYALPRPPENTEIDFVHKNGAVQSVIRVTYPLELRPGDPDVIRARLMNAILGGYFNSRLNANLREGKGYTYGSGSNLSPDRLVGAFSAVASVRNEVTDSAVVQILYELKRLRDEKVPAKELQTVKNVLTGEFAMSLENPNTVAEFALNTARYKLPADYYEKYLQVLQAVSAEEVLLMARKYLHPEKAHILVVGDKNTVAERLRPLANDKEVHFYDIFGDPVKATLQAPPEGLDGRQVVMFYVKAIGGQERIAALKDAVTEARMDIGGGGFDMKTWQKNNNRYAMELYINGQQVSRQVYDGDKARQAASGQSRDLEGQELADMKEQAQVVKEAGYLDASRYTLRLTGMQELDGKMQYVLDVKRSDGKTTTEYYDVQTGLKTRETGMAPGADGKPAEVTTLFNNYKETNGVLLPWETTVSGIFPALMRVTVQKMQFNTQIDDKVFILP